MLTSVYFNRMRDLLGFLLAGTIVALVWADIDHSSYEHFIEAPLFVSTLLNPEGDTVTLHFLINDLFMVLFFGIAMKEVSESFLPGGALSSIRKAAMPVVATAGGGIGPVAVFFGLYPLIDPEPAFCWRLGHPHGDRHRVLLAVRELDLWKETSGGHFSAGARRAR